MNTTMQTILASGSAKGTPMQRAIFAYLPNATNFYLDNIVIEGKGEYIYTLNGQKVRVELEDDFGGSIWVPAAGAGTRLIVRGEAIKRIEHSDNQQLTSLDLSGLTDLTYLDCSNNNISSLVVAGCSSLSNLECYHNFLTVLDLSGLTDLTYLDCRFNALSELNLIGLTKTETIDCRYNPLARVCLLEMSALANLSSDEENQVSMVLFNAISQDVSNVIVGLISYSSVVAGTVYLNSSDAYYSTVADAATAKGWTILPL